MKRPTIRDVARRAGVSIGTVSRVINGHPLVSEATRQRVLQAIAELNYRPDAVARSLVSARTHTVGLVLPDITSPFYPELVRGVEDVARAHGYTVILVNTDLQAERELRVLEALHDKRVDGLIFISADVTDGHLHAFARLGLPVVLAATRAPRDELPAVIIDNVAAARGAVAHLIRVHGHRRVGLISGPLSDRIAGKTRFEGYVLALREAGLPFLPELVEEGNYREPDGYRAAQRLLDLPEPPTAIFAASDEMAVGALNAALDRGLHVPADVALVGFDGIALADMVRPRLTTVVQPIYETGATAMRRLVALLAAGGPDGAAVTLLDYRLRVAGSCGCAAGGAPEGAPAGPR